MNAETKRHPDIALTPVESSQIAAIGYDAASKTLAIRFASRGDAPGALYHYANFTEEDFETFRAADSIGAHFGRVIRTAQGRYPFTRIDESQIADESGED